MEQIPFISQFLVYTSLVLLMVIIISFFITRKKNRSETNTEHPHSIIKRRNEMRSYIEKTSFEMRDKNISQPDIDPSDLSSTTSHQDYPLPSHKIPSEKRFTIVKGSSKE